MNGLRQSVGVDTGLSSLSTPTLCLQNSLAMMKNNSIIVNTSRGGLIDSEEVVCCLQREAVKKVRSPEICIDYCNKEQLI